MTFEKIWEQVSDINDHYAISKNELEFIITYGLSLPRYADMLELGVCHGRTFAALGLLADYKDGVVVGIDHFGLEGSADEVRAVLNTKGVTRYFLREADTRHVDWERQLDLLVVDAGHDEANVRPDIEKYVPFVKPGGFVFFDDYDETIDLKSPHWAVRYYADKACANWQDLGMVDSMRGWRRP